MSESRRPIFLAGLLLVLAGLAVYSNSLNGAFLFDDLTSIKENPGIQHGWREAFSPPADGQTVMGRPLLSLSFALNYRLGGLDPWGYHAVNLAIHLLGGLTLFGLVRRTLARPSLRAKFGESSLPLAFAIALLWTVHPLQTESVSYIAQRAESLVSLFYLLTLYWFIRGVESTHPWRWLGLSVLACLLGVFTKEVIATAPLLVFLYDRTFVAGVFKEAWQRRWKYYLALAGTWAPQGWLIVRGQGHFVVDMVGVTQRFDAAGASSTMIWWGYLLKQCEAIVHYLRLAFWPHPLILGYGSGLITHPLDVAPQALALLLLLGGTLWALVRRPALGFLGAWFFLILAPTSSVIPLIYDTMAERRMYLPLAAVLTLAVLGLWSRLGRRSLPAALVLAGALGGLTFERNRDYHSDDRMKHSLMLNHPDFDAENLRGITLDALSRREEALAHFAKIAQLNPTALDYHLNLANELAALGRWPEAEKEFLRTIRLHSQSTRAHFSYGVALFKIGRRDQAVRELAEAVRLKADFPEAYFIYGDALHSLGRTKEAYAQFEESVRRDPDSALAQQNMGLALLEDGQAARALPHARAAARLAPNDPEMRFLLGNALLGVDQPAAAEAEFRRALQLRPEYFEAQNNLGNALLAQNKAAEAITVYAQAVKLKPDNARVQLNYGNAFAQAGRLQEAMVCYQEALRLQPDYSEAHNNLGTALAHLGRLPEAVAQYQEALRLQPDNAEARKNLDALTVPSGK